MGGNERSQHYPMAFEGLGGFDRDFRSPQARQALDILKAPRIGRRPQLGFVEREGIQLGTQVIGDVDIKIGVKRGVPPAQLNRVAAHHEVDEGLVLSTMRAAGRKPRLEERLMVLVVRRRRKDEYRRADLLD